MRNLNLLKLPIMRIPPFNLLAMNYGAFTP